MHLGYSVIGVIIFLLPMIINIFYVIFPPKKNVSKEVKDNKFSILELIENVTRMLYFIALSFFVSDKELSYSSPFLYISIVFLILYHAVWIRYFINGRDVDLLAEKFLLVPIPLAIFPVLYFIFAALWMNNYIAVGIIIVFGVVHYIISDKNLKLN